VLPPLLADADGDALIALVCTVPAPLLAVWPPPACTAPTEFEAVLPPDPAIEIGAETPAVAPAWLAPTDGLTPVLPT
jgi:hypothetical protein